jgi:hypothetical protein
MTGVARQPLDAAFSPSHNGFKVIDFKEGLKAEEFPDNEIWTASPCLFTEEALFVSFQPLP